jgi:hypothetical protein
VSKKKAPSAKDLQAASDALGGTPDMTVEVRLPCATKKKKCKATHNTLKAKDGKWYCPAHHPDKQKEFKKATSQGGKDGGRVRREARDANVLHLKIEPNKASILRGFHDLANFIGDGLKKGETRKMGLLVNILDRIHEYATEVGDDEEKKTRVADIMASKLPDQLKLSKLVDIVGPDEALKLVPVTLDRDSIDDPHVLDGIQLLREGGDGKPTISAPEAFKLEVSDETADVPPVDLTEEGIKKLEEQADDASKPRAAAAPPPPPPPPQVAPSQASSTAPTPEAPVPPPPPPVRTEGKTAEQIAEAERYRYCQQQATELMGLYRKKVTGCFMPPQAIGAIFLGALLEGIPFKELQLRVLSPRSDTEQPNMMVNSLKAEIAKRGKTG